MTGKSKTCFCSEYLFADPEASGTISDYDSLDFVSSGSRLFGEIMWPGGNVPSERPCVIWLHGIPGSARNDDLLHALCRAGCVAVVPHCRGAWGSQGVYSVSHCIEDAAALALWASSDEFCERYRTSPDKVILGGHSLGGNIALCAAKRLPFLRALMLMTPYDCTRMARAGQADELIRLMNASAPMLHCSGASSLIDEVLGHLEEFSFESAAQAVRDMNICCFTGTMDTVAPESLMVLPLWRLIAGGRGIHRLHRYGAAHGLLGCRNAVIRDAGAFLEECLQD